MVLRSFPSCERLPAMLAALAFVGALVGVTKHAAAELLVYEPFDYAAGTVLDQSAAGGLNLAGEYTSTAPGSFELVVQSPGLDYGDLQGVPWVAGGRLIQTVGTTAGDARVDVDQDVVIGPGEAIYFSALFTFDDTGNLNRLANITFTDDTTGDELAFGEPIVGVRGVRVSANTGATGGLVADGADNAFVDGQTLLLVGRYVNGLAPAGDRLDLIGYDTSEAELMPANFDPADASAEFAYGLSNLDIDLTRISSITFRIRATNNNFIDELRIGTSYRSVIVPEPGSMLLVGLVLCGLAAQRRR